MKQIVLLLSVIVLISCGPTVGLDYDKQTDFSVYTTYNFYPNIQSGLSELDDKRIKYVADSLMQQKGLVKSETPQLFVNYFAKEGISTSRNSIGIGLGSGGRGVSVGGGVQIPVGGRNIEQQFTLDFIDVAKDDLVWQAVVDGTFRERATPEERESYYVSIFNKALKKYPPKK